MIAPAGKPSANATTDGNKQLPTAPVASTGKRKPPAAGRGRTKGRRNNVSEDVVRDILAAYKQRGGVKWLATKLDDETFARLFQRLVPQTSDVQLSGGLQISITPGVIPMPAVRAAAAPRLPDANGGEA